MHAKLQGFRSNRCLTSTISPSIVYRTQRTHSLLHTKRPDNIGISICPQMHNAPPISPITPTPSPTSTILPLSPPHRSPTALPLWVAEAVVLTLLLTTAVAVAVPVVAVVEVVGSGNESDVEFAARLQNCWASCSVVFNKVGHVLDIQETTPLVKLPLQNSKHIRCK